MAAIDNRARGNGLMFLIGTMRRIAPAVLVALLVPHAALAQTTRQRPPNAPANPAAPAPAPKAAQPAGGGPSFTTASYGDWILRCQQANGSRQCEVAQGLLAQGQRDPIAVIAITRDPARMAVQLPLNVTVRGPVRIALEPNDPPIDLEYSHCLPGGCFAIVPLTPEMLKRLRAQAETARMGFKDAGGRDVTLQFSLRGLSAALDALLKS